MISRNVSLDDVYKLDNGRVFATGIQALVRVALQQRIIDRAAGLNTGGFISGYRGSPLGNFDKTLWKAKPYLDELDIQFLAALNEELAATAIIGTQQLDNYPDADRDGVFGIWYGKGPGLDRAGDALKHANSIGTSQMGGVLVVAGDDHGATSSTMAHQSEQLMASWMMPVLHPASIQEYLEYGLFGLAMSRYSGCYVGFKAISNTVEAAGTITIDDRCPRFVLPKDSDLPTGGLHAQWPDSRLGAEIRLQDYRLPAAKAFIRVNRMDRVVIGSERSRYGIITTGKAHLDVMQALAILGISAQRASEIGLAVYKVAMPWPLETERVSAFAAGLNEILVVEEKRSLIESQLKDAFYHLAADLRPSVLGKTDIAGAPLLPSTGELSPALIARVIADRLQANAIIRESPQFDAGGDAVSIDSLLASPSHDAPLAVRPPFFCSGCPHNRSTVIPEGSRAFAGTGCHLMVVSMNRNTSSFLHMGGEGANWLGQEPFSKADHVFQNLGDGTYMHSGSLAIRQAVAAGANITYKLLFNDAVAMTGGQPVEGEPSVAKISHQLHHEGVSRIAVVSDTPSKYGKRPGFAPGTTTHHRDELQALQIEMRDIVGVSVIIYDQVCAAELRRRRKRGVVPGPEHHVFIYDAICEGCGDCSVKSNCLSVVPKETNLGRKRMIDQGSCNADFSCLEGLCPSFVTVEGGNLANPSNVNQAQVDELARALPSPTIREIGTTYNILVTGIGGTGVITIGQLIGMAAHLDGNASTVLDSTGLAQKGAGVVSCVRLAEQPDDLTSARLPAGSADLLLAGDIVVAMGTDILECLANERTSVVANSDVTPTGATVLDGDFRLDIDGMCQTLDNAVGKDNADFVAATWLAQRLAGHSIMANIFLLGHAWQKGWVPISEPALSAAIGLNGVNIDENKRAFSYGRLAAHDLEMVLQAVDIELEHKGVKSETLDKIIQFRSDYLSSYQNESYAERYDELVRSACEAEVSAIGTAGHYTEAVARGLFKLMAVKDEYEVARLYSDSDFQRQLARQFEGDFKFKIHLAPPLFARRDPLSGQPKKRAYGAWILPLLRILASFKGLRGGILDPFRYTAERRAERELFNTYIGIVGEVNLALNPNNYDKARELVSSPQKIRGYGDVRVQSAKAAERDSRIHLAEFRALPT